MGLDALGIGALSDFATTVVNKIWPDASQKQKDEAALAVLQLTQDYNLQQGQIDVNKEEAKSASLFVAGGRPFIMWICGFSLAYASLIEPLARFIATVIFKYSGAFPVIDTTLTLQVLLGLLGLGGMRTIEKWQGVSRSTLKEK